MCSFDEFLDFCGAYNFLPLKKENTVYLIENYAVALYIQTNLWNMESY